MATIEQQVKDLKKEKDYCCTQIMYQLAGLDALNLDDPVAQKALRGLGWGARTQLTCGAITGGADTFLSKNKARSVDAFLARWTKVITVGFFILVIAINIFMFFS